MNKRGRNYKKNKCVEHFSYELSYRVDLVDFTILFFNSGHCKLFFTLIHASARSFLNHCQGFQGFHIHHLDYAALHNQKVRVVNIELNRLKQILDLFLLCIASVNHVLVSSTNLDLARHWQFFKMLVANGRVFGIVKNDCHSSFVHTCLSILVYKLCHLLDSHLQFKLKEKSVISAGRKKKKRLTKKDGGNF